jgi:hypothetical protein
MVSVVYGDGGTFVCRDVLCEATFLSINCLILICTVVTNLNLGVGVGIRDRYRLYFKSFRYRKPTPTPNEQKIAPTIMKRLIASLQVVSQYIYHPGTATTFSGGISAHLK